MQNACIVIVTGFALWLASAEDSNAELLRTGGTGSTVETLRRLGVAFTKIEPGTRIEVVAGLGSSGGIAAVAAGAIDFSISGRPLGAADDQALKASVIARTPFGLASSHPNPGDVRSVDVADLFGSATAVWADGKPVRPVLRPKSDSDSLLLVRLFPKLAASLEKLRQRAEVPVAATDQDNATVAEQLAGSLTGMTLAQLQTENRQLHWVSVDGVMPTLQNLENGAYPHGKDIYLVVSSRATPALDRFRAFLGSSEGQKVLRENGSLPVQP